MAITHPDLIRTVLADTVVDLLDGGVLRYQTGAAATVADGAYGTPAFGPAVAGTATANAIGNATNSTGSTQVVAQYAARSPTVDVWFGSVTLVGLGGDIEMTNTSVANTEEIVTTGLTYTAAP